MLKLTLKQAIFCDILDHLHKSISIFHQILIYASNILAEFSAAIRCVRLDRVTACPWYVVLRSHTSNFTIPEFSLSWMLPNLRIYQCTLCPII